MLITFEGLDYSGKSTQVRLVVDRLRAEGHPLLLVREPGGTSIGETIRTILLDKRSIQLTSPGELFLFSASRAQLVKECIRPALEAGTVVICDRFYDSTTAYQAWGRGIPINAVNAVNMIASDGLVPQLTVFLDIPVDEIERRLHAAGARRDRMESNDREFYERVRQGYLDLVQREQRFVLVDGRRSIDQLHEEIWSHVLRSFAKVTNVS